MNETRLVSGKLKSEKKKKKELWTILGIPDNTSDLYF
jgi:hypothetical protein